MVGGGGEEGGKEKSRWGRGKIQSSGEKKKNNNTDSCNSPGGESFCLVFIETAGGGGGPSLRQRRFPGREQREGRRVPTTLPNRSHRSPLAGRCVTAETRHSPCGCGQVCAAAGLEVPVAEACARVCVRASGKSTKRRTMMSATSEFHSALSFLQICRGWRTCEAVALKACACARVLGSLTFLALCSAAAPLTPRQVYTNSRYFSYT